MMDRSRLTKVLGTLVVSMISGAALLNAMSRSPLSASAFCLSQYNDLTDVEESLGFNAGLLPQRWRQIEIRYGKLGDNCHFIICDGHIGDDGQIRSTSSWLSQFEADPEIRKQPNPLSDTGRTISICIAGNGENTMPTDFQIRRAEALIEELCRRFRIGPEAIRYPQKLTQTCLSR